MHFSYDDHEFGTKEREVLGTASSQTGMMAPICDPAFEKLRLLKGSGIQG